MFSGYQHTPERGLAASLAPFRQKASNRQASHLARLGRAVAAQKAARQTIGTGQKHHPVKQALNGCGGCAKEPEVDFS